MGTSLKKDEFVENCSNIDDVIIFYRDGTYKVTRVAEKVYIGETERSKAEKKKAEILQLLMLKPELAILDETDSGLDVDAVRTVSEGVKAYQKNMDGALLIITHSTRILEALSVDKTHVIVNGKIKATGDGSLVNKINDEGFESFLEG